MSDEEKGIKESGKFGEHYHVDVFVGDGRSFLRGLTVVPQGGEGEQGQESSGTWEVWDDFGLLGEPERCLAAGLSLAEAIRRALVLLRLHVDAPIAPAWGEAPFEVLGFTRPPSFLRWLTIGPIRLPWLRLRFPERPLEWVGPDGLPEHSGSQTPIRSS